MKSIQAYVNIVGLISRKILVTFMSRLHSTDMTKPAGETVPKQMQFKFDEITALTDAFSEQHLNTEYADMSRQLTAALCRINPSPLLKGKAKSWACGIVHALGKVNNLFSHYHPPYMKPSELYQLFGVSNNTGAAKSKEIRQLMNMHEWNLNWCLPSRRKNHPLIKLASVEKELETQRKGYLKRSTRLY